MIYRLRKPSPQAQLLGDSGTAIVPRCSPFASKTQIPPDATHTFPASSVFKPSGLPGLSVFKSAKILPFLRAPSPATSNTRTLRARLSATYSFNWFGASATPFGPSHSSLATRTSPLGLI